MGKKQDGKAVKPARKKVFVISNLDDPNVTFTVRAENAGDAALLALEELRYGVLIRERGLRGKKKNL